MKFVIYIFFAYILISCLIKNHETINYKNTEWLDNSPEIIKINSTKAQFSFTVTEPSAIYWRIYSNTNNISEIPEDLTNTNTINNTVTFGGNITIGNGDSYTNIIDNLLPNTQYYLYTIAVPYIGSFPKKIKKLFFQTSNQQSHKR